jgi:hypothetical protein
MSSKGFAARAQGVGDRNANRDNMEKPGDMDQMNKMGNMSNRDNMGGTAQASGQHVRCGNAPQMKRNTQDPSDMK